MSTITIPKAGQIEVPDPPEISCVEFVRQVIENINAQMLSLDLEVEKASKGDSGHVKALFDSMHEIKSRAEQASMILMDICADPAKLERAVARMDGPGDTFQRVKKLEESVQELEKELKEGEYDYFSVVADLLVEAQEQMSGFDAYIALPHISLVKRKLVAIESELRRQVQWIFREIGPLASSESYGQDDGSVSAVNLSGISKIELVVDALGEVFRKDLLGRFAQLQLIPYEKLFKAGTKYSGVEFMDHRYAWFKYLLGVVDSKFSDIFPEKWNVPSHLFVEFSRRTKQHISEVLAQTEKQGPVDTPEHVAFLLKAVKSVVAFQAEITASFAAKEKASSGEESTFELSESITDAFDPYLGPYVQLERKGLEDLMSEVLHAEDTGITEEGQRPSDPYESSRKMFEYIKGSLKRCTGFSTGITFLSLSKEFRICLQQYAESLKFRCPTPTFRNGKSGKVAIYRLTKPIEVTLCRIICTGEYCADTVPALETMMKARINKAFVEEVDFSAQIDTFMDMVSFAMTALASGEINRMEDFFADMRKVSWGTLDTVGDSSLHIKKMIKILHDCVPRIRLTMSNVYFQQICSKLASVFLDAFSDTIWSLKRICMTGGGQLLLDLNALKEYLTKMPNVRLPEGTEPVVVSKAYLAVVNNKVKKIEVVLKLVCTEDAMMEEMFGLLWPEGTKEDLDSINALKGSGRNILPLDQVGDIFKGGGDILKGGGDILKGGAKAVGSSVGNTGAGVGKNLKTGFNKVGDGFKNAFGEMMSGNLFDGSTHSSGEGDHSAHKTSNGQSGGTGNKAVGDFKNAFGGINAALGFKKAGAGANSTNK